MKTNTKLTVLATLGTVALGAALIGAAPAMAAGTGAAGGQSSLQGALTQMTGDAASTRFAADGTGICAGYLDTDGDGACDTCGATAGRAHRGCGRYSDENEDGICDTCASATCRGSGSGTGYVDADGDGACDHRDAESSAPDCANGAHHGHGIGAHHRGERGQC